MFNLKILRSDTGSLYEIPVNSSVLVGNIKDSLTSVTGLTQNEQILLVDSTNLSSNNTLEHYGIVKDTEIYLYNKKILDSHSYIPEEVNLSIVDFQIPRLPTPKNLKELEASLNPLNKLFTLDFYLNNHVVGTQYLKDIFENKVLQCLDSLNEINIQKKSIATALSSLDDYKSKLFHHYNTFITVFRKQSPHFESLLRSFDSDLYRLKQIKLHDALRTSTRVTLLDCVPEVEIRKWSEQCRREYDILKSRVMELGSQIDAIKDSIEHSLRKTVEINFQELNERLSISREHTKQFQVLHQTAVSNSEKIKKALETARNSKDPNQLSTIVMSFSEIKQTQEANFSISLRNAETLMSTLVQFSKAKNYSNQYVFAELRTISKLQSDMRQIFNNLSVWNEAIAKQTSNFFQLECIHNMPAAYEDALSETSRRRRFGNTVNANLSRFIQSLNDIRDNENQKRQKFIERVFQFLPPGVFNSLKEQLPQFQLHLPPFDNNLAPIYDNLLKGNDEDEFTMVDGYDPQLQSFKKKQPGDDRASMISSMENSKLMELQQKEKIENLEAKLQSTFLMASRAEDRYKDLLEKSKVVQSESITQSTTRNSLIDGLKRELKEKEQEIATLLQDNQSNQKSMESLQAHEAQLNTKLQELETENAKNLKSLEQYRDRVEQLQSESGKKDNQSFTEMSALRMELADVVREKMELCSEINDLKEQIARHEEFIQISNSSIIESKLQMNTELDEKSKLLDQTQETKARLENELSESKSLVTDTNRKLATLEQDKQALERRVSVLTGDMSELEKKLNDVKGEAQSRQYEIKAKEAQIGELQKTVESNEAMIKKLQVELEVLRNEVDRQSKRRADDSKKWEVESSQHEKEVTEKDDQIAKLKDQLAQFSIEFDMLRQQSNAKNGDVESKDTIIGILKEQLADLTNDSKQKDEVLNRSELQLRDNEESIKRLEARIQDLIKDVEEDTMAKDKSFNGLRQDLQESNSVIIVQTERLAQLETQVKEQQEGARKEKEDLLNQIQSLNTILKEKEQECFKLEKGNNDLQRTNSELLKKRSDGDKQIEELTKTKDTLEQSVEKQRKEIASLKASNEETINALNHSYERVDKMEHDEKELKKRCADMEKKLKDKEHTLDSALVSTDELSKKLRSIEISNSETNDQLLDSIEKLNEELEQCKEKLTLNEEKIAYLKKQLDMSNINYANSLTQMDKKEQQVSSLSVELQEASNLVQRVKEIFDVPMDQVSQQAVMGKLRQFKDSYLSMEKSLEQLSLSEQKLTEKIHRQLLEEFINSRENEETAQLSNFQHSRLAVFSYVKKGVYEAINKKCPRYYLSPDCFDSFMDEVSKKAIIIGSIIEVNEHKAEAGNMFELPVGTVFHELIVAKLA
ncbi:hypothetical protein SAMD00019534_007280 [Acytostelium subglobosum LB1]|uniref:hypothetical protein n=1 Tax=Acytostelium subglobosum LB1 TaxID=1410327 RepID=UPI000644A2EF|nr:hypothetical protein SAMD00019534_007280 [Acytostelium subglobosum LB1]GAM17553.1 hypothetical protein SAMD00019534_007280 [Acytostelium subglobosum LB1]|eukprot:XP_012759615.1 hypothetical protein SAMD00019534_007280 [Acytostelium subglobosum LB1]